MPTNGAAVALPRDLDPPTTPTEIEQRIGETVADAAIAVCGGIGDWQADRALSPATRARAGDLFVAMFKLQEATLGQLDFNATARREGRRVLWERHGAALSQHCGLCESALAPVLNEILDWPLSVLAKITAVERARTH